MLTTEFYLYAAWYILNIETLYLTIIARNYLSLSYWCYWLNCFIIIRVLWFSFRMSVDMIVDVQILL